MSIRLTEPAQGRDTGCGNLGDWLQGFWQKIHNVRCGKILKELYKQASRVSQSKSVKIRDKCVNNYIKNSTSQQSALDHLTLIRVGGGGSPISRLCFKVLSPEFGCLCPLWVLCRNWLIDLLVPTHMSVCVRMLHAACQLTSQYSGWVGV